MRNHTQSPSRSRAIRRLCIPWTLALCLALGLLGCAQSSTALPALVPVLPAPALNLDAAADEPEAAVQAASQALAATGASLTQGAGEPDLSLGGQAPGAWLVYERILVPVDRFSTELEGVSLADLRAAWTGTRSVASFQKIYPDESAVADLVDLLGPAGPNVEPRPAAHVPDAIWGDEMGLGILPFDALSVRVRALRLDGLSATDNRLKEGEWPLARRVWLAQRSQRGAAVLARLAGLQPMTNRDPARLTVLTMTGTTALTRGTAEAIENRGDFAWPARLVGPELAAADITTMSNETSFVDGCVPENRAGVALFCARPEYFATLEQSGIDLVGLTGNHLNDFGPENFDKTLDLYRARGIRVYGGGHNDREARLPLIVEHHGNRLAFIGANEFGPERIWLPDGRVVSPWASADTPGSATYDPAVMTATIAGLRSQADVIFAELQYLETDGNGDYQVEPVYGQTDAFRALLDAGADVMTGIQAHAPQVVELRGRGLILYGLGNLYFDQTWSWPTRTGLVARHTIYDHRLINTELLVTVIKNDMQVRWATPEERIGVLKSVFKASGW